MRVKTSAVGWFVLPYVTVLESMLSICSAHPVSFSSTGAGDSLTAASSSTDENGLVTGAPEPAVLAQAQSEKLPVMPIVALFNKRSFHLLATSAPAQAQMNAALIRECKLHGYTGFQFDLENVEWTDRDALSALVANTAAELHRANLQLSIATVPNAPGYPGTGAFAKWIYTDWRGAYDLAAIAKSVDLLCLMTYDQNTRWTTPGPVAGWQWTVDNLNYALQFVPKEKLSLGIPVYGYRWYAGDPGAEGKPAVRAATVGGSDVRQLMDTFHPRVQWDDEDRASFFRFYRDATREWVYFTDARTFQARYSLVTASGIQGFCSWVLGEEDPAIWDLLPDAVR